MARGFARLAILAAPACSADRALPLEAICGEASAREMLELLADEDVERIVVDRDREEVLFGVVAPAQGQPPSVREPIAVVTTGTCGEGPLSTEEGARLVTAPGVAALLCDGGGRLRARDDGELQPVDALDCEVAGTDLGVVALAPGSADGQGDLVLDPWGGGDVSIVLADVVRATWRQGRAWWAGPKDAIALQRDGTVRAVELEGLTESALAEGVADLVVAGDGAALLVQAGDDPMVAGLVSLFDRERGVTTPLHEAILSAYPIAFSGPFVALRADVGAPTSVFAREDGRAIELPAGTSFVRDLPQARIWLHATDAPYGEADERAFDPSTGEALPLYAGPGIPSGAEDGLEVFVPSEDAGIQRGTILSIPWSGGDPVTLAEDVGWQRIRVGDDGRFVSVLQTQDDPPLGELRLHDPQHSDPIALAADVLAPSIQLNRDDPFDGDLVWVGQRGDARALYRIRVPPRLP